eukprot:scaffold117418_cov65-Phaeocystis_antarctica.AAC.4
MPTEQNNGTRQQVHAHSIFLALVHNLDLLDLPILRIPHGYRLALLRKQQVLDAHAPAIEVVEVGHLVEHHRRQLERLLGGGEVRSVPESGKRVKLFTLE